MEKVLERVRLYKYSPAGIYCTLRGSAKTRKISFDLDRDEFISWYLAVDKVCVYCGTRKLNKVIRYNRRYHRFSIDRKDNMAGYTLENITLCCKKCNSLKSNVFSYTEMLQIGNRYLKPRVANNLY